jgi:hypothetical protein
MSPTIARSLSVLRCPISGAPLDFLSPLRLDEINAQILSGLWGHADPAIIPAPLLHALGTVTGDIVYRIDEDILCLLAQLAIRPRGDHGPLTQLSSELKIVQNFYDEFGWVKNPSGLFNDTSVFTETRHCARRYQLHCNARILALLDRGEYLLDVASGAIPHPEYREHSERYRTRICVDFSIRALREARAQIGEHGLFILGDITRLPLAGDAIDAVISLHTLYHLPADAQIKACDELIRVARPLAPVLVVYVWRTSPLMALAESVRFLPRKARRWWHRVRGRPAAPPVSAEEPGAGAPTLYFNPCDYSWFEAHIATRHSVSLRVWSAVTSEFQTRFFTDTLVGRLIARSVVWFEDRFPSYFGRNGQYPIWIFSKTAIAFPPT